MPFKDLREFIAKLEKEGEAVRIEEEVDWNLEAGAMVRRSHEARLPAPFFQKVRDYPDGYRLFGAILSKFSRIAIAMDMNKDTPLREISEEYFRRKQRPIKPVLVSDGPCKENVHIGNEVDVLEFPVPMIHGCDGGRYLGTWFVAVTKDPDSGWVNWGMYRQMVHDKKTLAMGADHHTHFGNVYSQRYEPNGIPMPVAIAIGTEPISSMCACTSMPHGVAEADIAGAIRGEPVELVKCETVDLEVPATSEIVIEGEIPPYERMDEGPFGEFTGYSAPGKLNRAVIHVTAVTHRNNPIFTLANPGMPLTDAHACTSMTKGAELLETLKAHGLPVTGVNVIAEASVLMAVVAVRPTFQNVASEVAYVVWTTRGGRATPYVIVVDDDVDPYNHAQVFHAIATKCHPWRGILKQEHTVGGGYFSWQNRHERNHRVGAKAILDCTFPYEWPAEEKPPRVSFDNPDMYPLEIQQKALAKWRKHGY